MNYSINTPEISLLRQKVEQAAQLKPHILQDYSNIAEKVTKQTGESISQSTIERLWQYSTRNKDHVSQHSLDVLSRYLGYSDWHNFVDNITRLHHPESVYFTDGVLDVASLTDGSILKISWYPDRTITIRFLGNNRFVIDNAVNSGIPEGSVFECLQIVIGQPMHLDRFSSPNDTSAVPGRYVIGRATGITNVEII